MFISEADFLQQIKEAAAEGAKWMYEQLKGEQQAELNKPVLISELAEKYGIHKYTLLRRARERHIHKVSLKPASVRLIDVPELIRA